MKMYLYQVFNTQSWNLTSLNKPWKIHNIQRQKCPIRLIILKKTLKLNCLLQIRLFFNVIFLSEKKSPKTLTQVKMVGMCCWRKEEEVLCKAVH